MISEKQKNNIILWISLLGWLVYVNVFAVVNGYSLLEHTFIGPAGFSYDTQRLTVMLLGAIPLLLFSYGFARSFILTGVYKSLKLGSKSHIRSPSSVIGLFVITFLFMLNGFILFNFIYR